MIIGYVKELTRHPVKSFQGEKVSKTKVMNYGLYGDRSHAFWDKTRVNKYLTITQCPEMVQYQAVFKGEETLDSYPPVQITTHDNQLLDWGDPALLQHMENLSTRTLEPVTYSPQHVPLGAIEEAHILMITDASLTKLTELWGSGVDARRFRPNLVIDLIDKQPFIEEKWLGKTIQIGKSVTLKLNTMCKRCMIITVNPETAAQDSSLLKTIVKERNNQFGVYASVVQIGDIQAGDEIRLLDH